jgi:hypothetical protein
MARVREPDAMSPLSPKASAPGALRNIPLRVAPANDNERTHAGWRRFVAASTAALFAASLILVGLVCIARADGGASFVNRTLQEGAGR